MFKFRTDFSSLKIMKLLLPIKLKALSLLNKNKIDNLFNRLMRLEPSNRIKTKKIALENFNNFFLITLKSN